VAWIILDDDREIMRLIDQVISERIGIRIHVEGEKTPFTSQIIRIDHGGISSEIGQRPELIIERLLPEKGNSLIQSFPEVTVEFSLNQSLCRCAVACIGPSSTPPHSGFIMTLPESLEIEERRREERVTYEEPESVSVQLRLGKGRKQERVHNLPVHNCSRHGLALLITQDDLELLHMLKKGERVNRMMFYTGWAVIEVNGRVAHKTEIETGEHRGCYLVGIESDAVIEYCKPWKEF
jgi:hypothetical protein